MKKKRVAIVTNAMMVGGIEKVLAEMLKVIDLDTYDITLWLRAPGGAFTSILPPNMRIKYWGSDDSKQVIFSLFRERKYLSLVRKIYYRLQTRASANNWIRREFYTARAMDFCDKERYDCVIAYQGMSPGVIGTALYRFHADKKIAWIHGEDAFPLEEVPFMEKEYKKFDYVFCVSNSAREIFRDRFNISPCAVGVFYNIVNEAEVVEKSKYQIEQLKSKSIVTVGRLAKEKGQDMIPHIARLLLDAGYEIYWYVIGDGDLVERIREEIQKFNVEEHVILLGTKTNPYPYIRNCDIYVQTSYAEGWCMATQEAKMLRKPIVTTNIAVMHEQFESGKNGIIADATSPESLFKGIKELLDSHELCEKLVRNLDASCYANENELRKLYALIDD